MHIYSYEYNGRMVYFKGNDREMKAHIINLFGTYFWRKRIIFGKTYFIFGHVEVRKD